MKLKMSSQEKGKHKPHTSVSKIEKIKSRVESCQEMVLSQSYERHLGRFHPQEKSKDKRAYGERKFFFGNKQVEKRTPLNS